MPDILQLQRQKTEKIDQMRAVMKKVDDEKRNLTEEEINTYDGLRKECEATDGMIERERQLQELESRTQGENEDIRETVTTGETRTQQEAKKDLENRGGFSCLGEFFYALSEDRTDPRLQKLRRTAPTSESRSTQQMGIGALGGFALPQQFWDGVMAVEPQEAIIRPRATIIPAGDPPDAEISVPTLDQGAAQNIYGGVVVQHTGENITLTETNAKLRKVTLKPKKITAYMVSSNELILNWKAATPFFQGLMRKAVIGAEDYDFYRGNGVNRAIGILNSACRVDYSRATASSITYADIVGMFARVKMGGSLVWCASQTTIPQLAQIRDTGNNNLWIQSAASGMPQSMFGFPILWNDRAPGLGTAGDLTLLDPSYYLVKDGSGPRIDISSDFLFSSDDTAFRLMWYVDGAAWLNEPLGLEGSTTDTVSPFVILN